MNDRVKVIILTADQAWAKYRSLVEQAGDLKKLRLRDRTFTCTSDELTLIDEIKQYEFLLGLDNE